MTAFFPVKTLQSITVTPTPAAPTCLVGGTANVALKVVANYLEGTVATTEEVLTGYTTTANWAAGVFTAATTVAGTENITVTFNGKTADVPVTISTEAPVASTVEVTFASTMMETSQTAAVVVVKDQFGAAMTTGFTTTYAITTGNSTVSTAGLVTAGAYDANTATNNNHVLTVTVTPTTGTALTKTAAFTVTADTTKPELVKVEAISNKVFTVTYSKNVSKTTALDPAVASYKIYHAATGVTSTIGADASGQDLEASFVFADSSTGDYGKVVKVTILKVKTGVNGYPAGGLDNVKYRLYVSEVKDITTNKNVIVANSNYEFLGTTTPDTNKPVLLSAAYNKGTGKLLLAFDKAVNSGSVAYAKIKFNGTALTSAVTVNNTGSTPLNQIDMTLAAADKAVVSAITTEIQITLLAAAVTDTLSNTNDEVTKVVTLTVPPSLSTASYDEATNTLTLGFSQTLDMVNSTFVSGSKFQIKSDELVANSTTFYLTSGDTVVTTSNSSTVQVLLSNTNATKIETVTTHTNAKVIVAVNAVKNTNGDYNVQQDDTVGYPAVSLSITKDTTKPAVTSITYVESTKILTLNFNASVSRTLGNNVTFNTDRDNSSLGTTAALTVREVTDGNKISFDITGTALATNFKTEQQGDYKIYAVIPASTFTKSGSILTNDAVNAKATATTLAYTDDLGPALKASSAITVVDATTITAEFDEKLDTVSSALVANYKVWLMSGSTKVSALNVYVATLTDATTTKKVVRLTTATQTASAKYLLEVAGVKDMTGNLISTTDTTKYSQQFDGSIGTAAKPMVLSAKIKDNGNGSLDINDYVQITFNRSVKINTSSTNTAADCFTIKTGGVEKIPAAYAKTNVSVDATDDKIVYIKVGESDANKIALTVGTSVVDYINGGTLIVDKYSDANAVVSTELSYDGKIYSPTGAPVISEALLTDVDNSGNINKGDTLRITFGGALKVKTGTLAIGNIFLDDNKRFATTAATFTTDITTTTGATTVTLTFNNAPEMADATKVNAAYLKGKKVAFDDGAAGAILKDSWDIDLAIAKTATITYPATIAAPYITKAEWIDADSSGTGSVNDLVYVTFNVPVSVNAAVTAQNKWKIAGVDVPNAALGLVEKVTSNNTQLLLKLGGNATLTPNVTAFDINKTNLTTGITNFAGLNAVEAADVPVSVVKVTVPVADATLPSITSLAFTGEKVIKAVFNKAVNTTNYAANTLVLKGASSGDINVSTAVVDTTDTTGKTVTLTLASAVSIGEQSNGITGSLTAGLLTNTGNKIFDTTGNMLAPTASGATYMSIGKDVTAPTAPTTTDLAKLKFNNTTLILSEKAAGTGFTYSELALLEVVTASSTPAVDVTTNGIQGVYTSDTDVDAGTVNGDIIAGLTAATGNHKVYYRLVDRAGNKSAWVDSTTTVPAAPNATDLTKLGIVKDTGLDTNYEMVAGVTALSGASMTLGVKMEGGAQNYIDNVGTTNASGDLTVTDAAIGFAKYELADTPKYYYTNAAGNVSALSAADGAVAAPTAIALTDTVVGGGFNGAGDLLTVTFGTNTITNTGGLALADFVFAQGAALSAPTMAASVPTISSGKVLLTWGGADAFITANTFNMATGAAVVNKYKDAGGNCVKPAASAIALP